MELAPPVRTKICGIMLWTLAAGVIAFNTAPEAYADTYIVENGQPNAQIVLSKNEERPRMAVLAALDLQNYIEKITGARLPLTSTPDRNVEVSIYVGESTYTKSRGVSADGLNHGAFRMVSGDNWLVLLGDDFDYAPPEPWPRRRSFMPQTREKWDELLREKAGSRWVYPFGHVFESRWNRQTEALPEHYGEQNAKWWRGGGYGSGWWLQDRCGSLNAVSEFLRTLGVRWYMPGELGEVVPQQDTIRLPSVNKTVTPDYPVRSWNWYSYKGFSFGDVMWAQRLGMNSGHQVSGNGGYAHGLTRVHSRKEMRRAHPEYYALHKGKRVTDYNGGGHVCFSSRDFYRETVKFARFMFDHYDQPHVSIWPQDGFHKCNCKHCRNTSASELVWSFVDRVARELYKTHPNRLVSCGAYTPYIHPPDSVDKFPSNVVVMIANAGRVAFDNMRVWDPYWTRVQDWNDKLAPKHILRYENNRYGLGRTFPVIHPHAMAKDLRHLKDISLGDRCEEAQKHAAWHSPGFDHLTLYVQSRFLWDAEQDLEALLKEYYNKFYGPAGEEMKKAITFAEDHYSRTDTSRSGRRCNPRNVPLKVRVRFAELLNAARKTAGDNIYGKRIQVIIDEYAPLDELKRQLVEQKQAGDPRADTPVVTAYPSSAKEGHKMHKLNHRIRNRNADLTTSFQVAWEKDALIFAIMCREPDMDALTITEDVWKGDSVLIFLESPSHSYYHIEINPEGEVFDAAHSMGGRIRTRWNSMADVKVTRNQRDKFWYVRARIPIALAGKEDAGGDPNHYVVGPELKPGDEWYFNIGRRRIHGDKETYKVTDPRRDADKTMYIFSPTGKWGFFDTPGPGGAADRFAKLHITKKAEE